MAKQATPLNNQMSEEGYLRVLASTMVSRAALASSLGKSFGTERDIYTALGYTKSPQFENYFNRFDRQDVAKRIVEAYPNSCWRKKPEITESKDTETQFEKRWKELVKQHKLWHYLRRIDTLSGIGQYGVLFIGFDDVTDRDQLVEPVKKAKNITYLRPLMENQVEIDMFDREPTSDRYSLPLQYKLNIYSSGQDVQESLTVHYSRVIHVAENPLTGELYGTPRLKPVLNRLQDLELVAGGSGEMFWRGAFPGFNFSIDKDFDTQNLDLGSLQDEIDEYVHSLKRYIRTQGVTAESLSQQVADPSNHVDILLKLISGATGIPVRIFTGSERGELASSQDEGNWNDRVDERRQDYCEPFILRPFIDRLIDVGILPKPAQEYVIEWPDIDIPSEKEEADIGKVKTDTLTAYVNSQGADMIVRPEMFLRKFMGFSEEDVKQMAEALGSESLDDGYDKLLEEEEKKRQAAFDQAQTAAKQSGKLPPGQPQPKIQHMTGKHDQKKHGHKEGVGSMSPEAVLYDYQNYGYDAVNSYLRNNEEGSNSDIDSRIKALDELIDEQEPSGVTLFRGDGAGLSASLFKSAGITEELDKAGVILNNHDDYFNTPPPEGRTWDEYLTNRLKGKIFQDRAYVSTSVSKKLTEEKFAYASSFTNLGVSGLVRINGDKVKSLNVDKITKMGAKEGERLLARNTKFKINRVQLELVQKEGYVGKRGEAFRLMWDVEIVE